MGIQSFRFRGESQVLDENVRSSVSGEFIELPDGIVHYEIKGPADGQPVVLMHGFAVPYYTWDRNFGALVEAGFRVLRYDMYGRGYSDRPEMDYSPELFDRQLSNLLDALNIDRPVDLIGFSMGGGVAINFADRHPEMTRKIVLVSPGGFPLKIPFAFKLILIRGVGERIMSFFGDSFLLSSIPKDFYRPEKFPGLEEKFRTQMKYKGFKRAMLSTMRHGIMDDMTETYKRVGRQKHPVLLIWGRHDQVLPFETHEKVSATIPHLEFQAIEEAGHGSHIEQSERVNPLLISFLGLA